MYPMTHFALSIRLGLGTACGKGNSVESISQWTDYVTCRACKRTRAFKQAAFARPRPRRTRAWALLK